MEHGMTNETEYNLRPIYSTQDIVETMPNPKIRGSCAFTELYALNFFLNHGEESRVWHEVHMDDGIAQSIRIGDLPSHLIVSQDRYLIAIPQEDGSLLIRRFNWETLCREYETLCNMSENPYMNLPPEIRALARSLKDKVPTPPTQEELQELFFNNLFHEKKWEADLF